MAERNPGSPSRAFFLELLLVLTIFVLCAAICLQVFAAAKTASETSRVLSALSVEAQSMAEIFKAGSGDVRELAKATNANVLESAAIDAPNTVVAYYDESFLRTQTLAAPYKIVCIVESASSGSDIAKASVSVFERSQEIATFNVSRYAPLPKGGVGK